MLGYEASRDLEEEHYTGVRAMNNELCFAQTQTIRTSYAPYCPGYTHCLIYWICSEAKDRPDTYSTCWLGHDGRASDIISVRVS